MVFRYVRTHNGRGLRFMAFLFVFFFFFPHLLCNHSFLCGMIGGIFENGSYWIASNRIDREL